jgi:hypothetical protein
MDPKKFQPGKSAKGPPVERIRYPFHIPYYAQVASPEWAEAVFDCGADPRGDPRWTEWAARDPEEYAHWCSRACGPVCVKMCVESMGGAVKPVMAWVRQGLVLEGYEVKPGADGQPVEIGWKHATLAGLIASAGFYARPMRIANLEMVEHLSAGHLLIASVSYEIGTLRPVTQRGGHLVVVTGVDRQDGETTHFILHNPSGRTPALRENAAVPAGRFFQAYAGRAIVVSERPLDELDSQEQTHV